MFANYYLIIFLSDGRFGSLNPRFWPPTVDCDELDNNEIQIRYLHFSSDWKGLDGDEITTFFYSIQRL